MLPWLMLPWLMLPWLMLPWLMLPWLMLPWPMLAWLMSAGPVTAQPCVVDCQRAADSSTGLVSSVDGRLAVNHARAGRATGTVVGSGTIGCSPLVTSKPLRCRPTPVLAAAAGGG